MYIFLFLLLSYVIQALFAFCRSRLSVEGYPDGDLGWSCVGVDRRLQEQAPRLRLSMLLVGRWLRVAWLFMNRFSTKAE